MTRPRTKLDLLGLLGQAFVLAGHRVFLVGGSVRDQLLGRPLKDLDLTTDATPDRIRAVLKSTEPDGLYDVGARFGTIGAVYRLDDGPIDVEITTFRTEAYEPGSRKPAVAYGTSLVEDLSRRDLTINAMARDVRTNEVIDPFEGQRDLRLRLIRAVGDPAERFREDPLRMLRAIRLAVELGFTLEPGTAGAIQERAGDLETISRERIAEELNRILVSPEPARGLQLMADLGLMTYVVPELLPLRNTHEGRRSKDVFAHTLRVVQNAPPDLVTRWAALLHDVGKPKTLVVDGGEVQFPGHERVGESMARQILAGLRLDSATIDQVAQLVGLHMRPNQYEPEWTDGAVRRLMRDAGPNLDRLLALSEADVTSQRAHKIAAARARVEALRRRCAGIAEQEEVAKLKSPLDGHDLMRLFDRPPGPWIKPVKDYLLDLVLDGELAPDDRDRAAELARAFMAAGGG
ncbi:MAG TPA: HD domain-containing protein [Chloroflexota bacterium]|nr:HD domain-containing protein [Chloroflexota bacterium]